MINEGKIQNEGIKEIHYLQDLKELRDELIKYVDEKVGKKDENESKL